MIEALLRLTLGVDYIKTSLYILGAIIAAMLLLRIFIAPALERYGVLNPVECTQEDES